MELIKSQDLYLDSLKAQYVQESTLRKYKSHFRMFNAWAESQPLTLVGITTLHLKQFFAERQICQNTAHKETQFYRTFFAFCEDQGWIAVSPARKLKSPKFRCPDKKPYTQEEIIRIISACDRVGQNAYERLRARAAILILRHHALRISDVLGLRRDAITELGGHWTIRLQAHKNQRQIEHPVCPEVLQALECLPVPIGCNGSGNAHFFWNGVGAFKSVMDNMGAILRDVYRLSGVQGAHNHRFRHTRASEILVVGGSTADVALWLGITNQIADKHYIKLMPERFQRLWKLSELLLRRDQVSNMEQEPVPVLSVGII